MRSSPPTAIEPLVTAMASSRVDLPLPFSPTKNVTGDSRVTSPSCRTTGKVKGYSSGCLDERFILTVSRWIMLLFPGGEACLG